MEYWPRVFRISLSKMPGIWLLPSLWVRNNQANEEWVHQITVWEIRVYLGLLTVQLSGRGQDHSTDTRPHTGRFCQNRWLCWLLPRCQPAPVSPSLLDSPLPLSPSPSTTGWLGEVADSIGLFLHQSSSMCLIHSDRGKLHTTQWQGYSFLKYLCSDLK